MRSSTSTPAIFQVLIWQVAAESFDEYFATWELIAMGAMGLGIISFLFCCLTGCYRLHPHWGPICMFDTDDGHESRINQCLIHEHAKDYAAGSLGTSKTKESAYGATAEPPWGRCEATVRQEYSVHPVYGRCRISEGLTQTLRENNPAWPRDEPHFMSKLGVSAPPLQINERFFVPSSHFV